MTSSDFQCQPIILNSVPKQNRVSQSQSWSRDIVGIFFLFTRDYLGRAVIVVAILLT